jgi:DNA invertase Pin-like site-specific DNA recombinase
LKKITKIENEIPVLPQKLKVAAYARVSKDSDEMAHSLSAQISYYSELIQKNPKWEYAGVYADYGISGTGISRRDEFKRLIDDCESGRINLILTKSVSRFARNTVDLLQTIRHLKEIGVEVRFQKENISTFSMDGEILITMLADFAEQESKSTSENIRWSIRKKFEKGKQWHVPAYGYKWNGKTFIVDDYEAEVIKVIFNNYLNDVPIRQTSRWLKENGYDWSVPFINYALQNVVYVGDLILQKYFVESYRTHKLIKNTGQLPRYYVKNNHQAIIDRETFDKVQEKIKANYDFNLAAHRIVKPSCFSAKIICGKCGCNYFKDMVKSNAIDGFVENWVCYGKRKKQTECGARNIHGGRLRKVCCEILELDEFDELIFSKQIEKIVTTDTDILKFYFYDGRIKEAKFQYHSINERAYKDPHTRFFAYRWSSKGYQIIEKEAEAVKLIYQYYADGWKISDISRELESKGYKSCKGKLSRKVVTYALDSEVYIGKRIVKGQFTESGKDLVIENDHESIIDIELNEKVKQRRIIELKKQERRIATRRETARNEKRDSNTSNN